MSYYVTIGGQRMDRKAIEFAKELAASSIHGFLTEQQVEKLIEHLEDGQGITRVELATLKHIFQKHLFTFNAFQLLRSRFPQALKIPSISMSSPAKEMLSPTFSSIKYKMS